MKINSVGYDFRHGKDFKMERQNGLNEYLFLIIRSTADFYINEEKFSLKPNSMIFISKNNPHSFYANSDLFVNDWVAVDFTPKEYKLLFKDNIKFDTFFSTPDVCVCSELIKLMQNENMSFSLFKDSNMMYLLQIIFNKLRDNSENYYPEKFYYNKLRKIRDKIYNNPTEKYCIEGLSEEAHLSKTYFQYCYKMCFNVTPINDVINSKIEYAKQLLASTEFSIAKISDILGYQNDTQFIKQFKSVAKITLGKYRQLVTKNHSERKN